MKSILVIAASGMTVGGLYAAGAFDRGQVYDLPIGEVRSRLVTVQIPRMAAVSAAGSDRASADFTNGDTQMRWRLGSKGAVFSATLTPEGPAQTRVLLDYEPAKVEGEGGSLLDTRFMRGFAETSFAEEVDARLEGRVADQAQAMRDFARQISSDPEAVRELGVATQEMFKSVSDNLNETMRHSRFEPSAGQRIRAATEPTVKLPVQSY